MKTWLLRFLSMWFAAIIASVGPYLADPHLAWWAFVSVGGVVGWIYPQPKKRRL